MLRYLGIDDFASVGLERCESTFLVNAHQAAVAGTSAARMAASRRSTRASAMKIAPTHAISNRVYYQERGVSIEQRCPRWVNNGDSAMREVCPLRARQRT